MSEIPTLIRVFAYLSLLTVGGGMAAFPEMKVMQVPQLTLSGDYTSVRLLFAFFGVNECNGDLTSIDFV